MKGSSILLTSHEKTLKRNWQKIVVIRIHENGDGRRINTEDIKEPVVIDKIKEWYLQDNDISSF